MILIIYMELTSTKQVLPRHVLTLKRYLEHITASWQKTNVKEKWRHPLDKSKPNEQLMDVTEVTFEADFTRVSKSDYRRNIIIALLNWSLENPTMAPEDNYEQIFPDLVEKLKSKYAVTS